MPDTLTDDQLRLVDGWWRAANYLTVGQIYLRDNPLLRSPLQANHIKPRLLGHWGTSPGLNLLYAHLNRVIARDKRSVLFVTGPGHGGPAILANVYLEGTYSGIYPDVSQNLRGMEQLFRQFSTPGGVPSHVSVPTPGSIHEGGELGYSLVHAFGAAFDNPNLLIACVVGDGEAETGPLEGSWKGIDFLNPVRDGAVLPILHLNGYKISGPTVMGRWSDDRLEGFLTAHGYAPTIVSGDEPEQVHRDLATALDRAVTEIDAIQADARTQGFTGRPAWPALVLRTPKGWTGPKEVGGLPVEGTWRAHQVPLPAPKNDPEQLAQLEEWMQSYRPEELFDADGTLRPELAAAAPTGEYRMGSNPHANGGRLLVTLDLPEYDDYALEIAQPGSTHEESTRVFGRFLRDVFVKNDAETNFRLFCPDETNSNRLGAVFDVENRCSVEPALATDDHIAPDGRVMEVLSEHLCEGWLEGYVLTGRHGLFATYEAFAMVSASMLVQHTKWLEASLELGWRRPVSSLNVLLTSTCWRNDHNGFSHQGPGLIDVVMSKRSSVARIYLPPDANCLLSVGDHCLRSRDYVNLIVIDKQPELQFLDMHAAREHCTRGIGRWDWASTHEGDEPDIVLASAGDIPTLEMVAAAWLLRSRLPDLRFRFVNIVDLMTLMPADAHPHGMDQIEFEDLFTPDKHVVLAFHGYPRAVHFLIHGQRDTDRFHVRGFEEQGTTTTPFDMVVKNRMSRYHLVKEVLRRLPDPPRGSNELNAYCDSMLAAHHGYVREHLEDMPEIRDWTWTEE